eukprot:TRINITY_DN2400_c0_g1_i2.p1 TRINITY_DN2400_c0_g1~~TRINITY_DN2400_c0_g1_i2.p1  ORF type:complete len:176 (-),score=45.60 TRINITY_DN2400_c0_g1_i2:28-555(-)
MTHFGKLDDLLDFDLFLGDLPHRHKIVIPGNHDIMFQDAEFVKKFRMKNATVLLDVPVVVDGFKIYGSSWQPQWTGTGFFMPPGPAIESKWERIPHDTDILVTHSPPYGFGDKILRGHLGCKGLRKRVDFIHPMLHVFGHIHENPGMWEENGTIFVNASLSVPSKAKPAIVDLHR